jgi:uncharacterized repeat protein (TIGR01451 family)
MLKSKYLLTGAAIGVVVAGLNSAPALGAGTAAGSTITNEVTVSYSVSGNPQADEEASNDITVDRKVDLTVAASDGTATSVAPGAEDKAVSFQVTNLSNDTLDFALSAAQAGGDDFDTNTPYVYYLDDGDGVFEIGQDAVITYIDELESDDSVIVHVSSDSIPLGLDTGDLAGLTLTATGRAGGGIGSQGAALTQAVSNTVGVDTIFADGAGVTDGTRDAAYSATDQYEVLTAALSATKSSTIVAGSYGTGAAIPGATIRYCITVTNAPGGAAATSLTISDTLPGEVTYDSGFGVLVGGANCADLVTDNGSGDESAGVVSGTIATLNAGSSQTLIFQATID